MIYGSVLMPSFAILRQLVVTQPFAEQARGPPAVFCKWMRAQSDRWDLSKTAEMS